MSEEQMIEKYAQCVTALNAATNQRMEAERNRDAARQATREMAAELARVEGERVKAVEALENLTQQVLDTVSAWGQKP